MSKGYSSLDFGKPFICYIGLQLFLVGINIVIDMG